jgi:hypothetical protein
MFAEHSSVFYDVVGLGWRLFDRVWVSESASAPDFERIVDLTAVRIRTWLEHGPQSLEQLRSAAEMEGVAITG